MIVRAAGGAEAFLDVGDTGGFDFAVWQVGVEPHVLEGAECWEEGRLLVEALCWRRKGFGVWRWRG